MISKRKKLLLGSLVVAALTAFVGAVVKMIVEEHKETVLPIVSVIWDWMVGVYESLVQPTQIPLWLLIVALAAMAGVIAFLIVRNRKLAGELSTALVKLNPPIPPLPLLNEDQQEVLIIVARHDDEGMELVKDDVRGYTELSKVACDGALDVLYEEGLINILYGRWGTQVMLQPNGRKYVLDSRSPLAWAPKRA